MQRWDSSSILPRAEEAFRRPSVLLGFWEDVLMMRGRRSMPPFPISIETL